MTKLICDVKIKSMEEDKISNMCVGFLIIWCKPICEVSVSIFAPSMLVSSLNHQFRRGGCLGYPAVGSRPPAPIKF